MFGFFYNFVTLLISYIAVKRLQTAIVTKLSELSSSAVAERPRDTSCLSVVTFDSTKRRAQYFIVTYVG